MFPMGNQLWKKRKTFSHIGYWKNKHLSEEHRKKLSEALKGHPPTNNGENLIKFRFKKGCLSWTKIHPELIPRKEKRRNWKGGTKHKKEYYKLWCKKNKDLKNFKLREWRHKNNFSKRFISKYGGYKIPKRYFRLTYKYHLKLGGKLTTQTIQQVYEDNIKQYGTLTCYLCLKPIPFGKDHLEHKIPLSRGGTNARDNLDIACQKCNCSKNNKTEEEYKKEEICLGDSLS